MLKRLNWLFVIITGALAGYGLLMMDDSIDLLFPAPLPVMSEPPSLDGIELDDEPIEFKACMLDTRYMLTPGSDWVFLICHDGRGTLNDYLPMLTTLRDLNLSALLFDYRQNGMSSGSELKGEEFEKNLKEDIYFAYGRLLGRQWAPWKIVVYGMGLGATAAAEIAGDNECAAFITEHAYPTASEVVSGRLQKFLMRDRFNLRKALVRVRCPLLFLTGDRHPWLDPQLAASLISTPDDLHMVRIIPGADDRPMFRSQPEEWKAALRAFISRLPVRTERPKPLPEVQDGT